MSIGTKQKFTPANNALGFVATELVRSVGWGDPDGYAEGVQSAHEGLIDFTRRVKPDYQPAEFHLMMADRLEALERGDIRRLVLTLPPRHGKTELASVNFPAWFIGRDPRRRVILTSHTASLAHWLGRRVRDLIRQPEYPWPHRINPFQAAARFWELQGQPGGMASTGVGGPITGLGADLLIVDDPVKSAAEAQSQAIRDRTWEWYRGTAFTRLQPGGRMVLIGTRWHNDDLIGRVLANEIGDDGEPWEVIHLPALARENVIDPLGRQPGEALWPERYPARSVDVINQRKQTALEDIYREVGAYQWNAQYQGVPSEAAASIIRREWWSRYDLTSYPVITQGPYFFMDTAYKSTDRASYSVIAVWAITRNGLVVLDVWRDRVAYPALKRKVVEMSSRWNPEAIVIEDKGSGQSLVQEMRESTRLNVISYLPKGDKVTRLSAQSPSIEAGRIAIPQKAPWLDAWVDEHSNFPLGDHDDQVDTTSMAIDWLERRVREASGYEIEQALEGMGL